MCLEGRLEDQRKDQRVDVIKTKLHGTCNKLIVGTYSKISNRAPPRSTNSHTSTSLKVKVNILPICILKYTDSRPRQRPGRWSHHTL